MTTAMSDVDRTSMRCTVCRQLCRGRKPKILPCSHTFCVKCLESLVRTPHAENIEGFTESTEEFSKLVITCPTCMKVFPVPIGGVKCFLSNSYLDDETGLETDKPVPLCDFCEGNHTAKDNCKECKSKFCAQCRETHNMICPEREVIPLCSKPLATLQTINNGYLGIESVREQIEVLEAVLSRLDEEEVEVEHQKQAIESDIKARYDAVISTLTEAHDVCWNSLRAAVQKTRARLQEERTAVFNAREKLTNLASDASTSSEDDLKRDTHSTLLNGTELSHFKQRASKIRQPLFFAYTSGRASVQYMMNFFRDYMGHVSSLGGLDRFLETEVHDHEATFSQDELFPPRREDSELKILTAKVELLIDMVRPTLQIAGFQAIPPVQMRPTLQTAGFQAIPPVQMRPTLQTAGFQAIPPVQMRPRGPSSYSTYFTSQPTAARTALYASPVTNQSVAAHAPTVPPARQENRYKFTTAVIRNPPVVKQQVPPPRSGVIPEKERLTATTLAACPPQERKQMLGERLFPLIQRMYPEVVGKITGMLLEIDNSELLQMLDSHESLKTKVEEAFDVLQRHQAKEAAAAAEK